MNLRQQLRWGGWWIIVSSVLMNGMNIVVYLRHHNATIQAIYGMGFTGLILTATIIHIAQARKSGALGLLAYLITVLSLVYSNVVTFLILADLAGIQEAQQALTGTWSPVMHIAVYGIFLGFILLGISIARAKVLPGWAGIFVALGVALQLPAQYAMDTAGPLFFLFTIGGSILFGAGLIWIGWALWSRKNQPMPGEVGLSTLDRIWGAPFILLTACLIGIDAYVNTFGGLTLMGAVIHVLSFTTLLLSIGILQTAQAHRAGHLGGAGFVLMHVGLTLSIIPAYLIVAQLAGQIDSNRLLMASWVDIPIGRFGNYMLLVGILLFGVSVLRAEVFPRGSGWLIVIGLLLLLPAQFQSQAYLFLIFWVIGATLEGIGFAWMGWSLLNKQLTKQAVQFNESAL